MIVYVYLSYIYLCDRERGNAEIKKEIGAGFRKEADGLKKLNTFRANMGNSFSSILRVCDVVFGSLTECWSPLNQILYLHI